MTRPDQIDTPSRYVLPGCRHWPGQGASVPGLVIAGAAPPPQVVDLTTLHPLAHRMDEALELLVKFSNLYRPQWGTHLAKFGGKDAGSPTLQILKATRALLRASGWLSSEGTP